MSDHTDDRTWTIARLLFATHLPFLLLAYGYGLYFVNRLLPVYVAHGRTRHEFLRIRNRVA